MSMPNCVLPTQELLYRNRRLYAVLSLFSKSISIYVLLTDVDTQLLQIFLEDEQATLYIDFIESNNSKEFRVNGKQFVCWQGYLGGSEVANQ